MTNPAADTRKRLPWIIAALMLSMLMSALGQMVFSTALPTIVGELGGVEHMSWVISGFLVAETIALPIFGKLGDQMGRKNLFMLVNGLFVIGSFMGGSANSMLLLIIARIVQGIAAGGMMILSQSITAEVTTPRERGKYMGIMGSAFAVASVLGPVLGGWFTDGPGWRWGLWLNIPIGFIAMGAIWFLLRLEPKKVRLNLDIWGMITMIIATSSLVLTLTWGGNEFPWLSAQILGLALLTIIFGALFIFIESRTADPIVPMRVFRNRNFALTTIASFGLGIFMFGSLAYMPTYLQMVHAMTPTHAGLMMITMMLGILITSLSVGNLVSRTGKYKRYPIVGMAVVTVALVLLSTLTSDTSLVIYGIYMFIFGFGIGATMQVLVLIAQTSFPVAEVGTVTGTNNFIRQIGSAVGAALVGGIFVNRLTTFLAERLPQSSGKISHLTPSMVINLPEPIKAAIESSYNDALTPIFLLLAPLSAICCVALLFLREEHLQDTNA
ncbi:MDR family MFS transporter [Corynebacterium caspium]|uniref:MDR family MFS transporter n=1 Tax=Corynebacterium caspium TaxID=234828 RepID=UPI00036E4F76|nr:MDR family MFS transporter [Corynebacterium caspium]WKD59550.1 Multidrug resistance protein 3 [Corynebacterium caspium DSM 44850]